MRCLQLPTSQQHMQCRQRAKMSLAHSFNTTAVGSCRRCTTWAFKCHIQTQRKAHTAQLMEACRGVEKLGNSACCQLPAAYKGTALESCSAPACCTAASCSGAGASSGSCMSGADAGASLHTLQCSESRPCIQTACSTTGGCRHGPERISGLLASVLGAQQHRGI